MREGDISFSRDDWWPGVSPATRSFGLQIIRGAFSFEKWIGMSLGLNETSGKI